MGKLNLNSACAHRVARLCGVNGRRCQDHDASLCLRPPHAACCASAVACVTCCRVLPAHWRTCVPTQMAKKKQQEHREKEREQLAEEARQRQRQSVLLELKSLTVEQGRKYRQRLVPPPPPTSPHVTAEARGMERGVWHALVAGCCCAGKRWVCGGAIQRGCVVGGRAGDTRAERVCADAQADKQTSDDQTAAPDVRRPR